MIVLHSLFALPILILVWMCDFYLVFIFLRVITQLPSIRNTTLARAVRDVSDPLGSRVSRGLAALHSRAASPRITYLTSAVILILMRYVLLWFALTAL